MKKTHHKWTVCVLALVLALSMPTAGYAAHTEDSADEARTSWFGELVGFVTDLFDGDNKAETESLPEVTETPTPTGTPEPTAPLPPEPLQSAEYEIVTQNHSLYNDKGQLLIEFYYDQVILQGGSEAVERINRQIEEDHQQFIQKRAQAIRDYGDSLYLDPDDKLFMPFTDNVYAGVAYNTNGIISISLVVDWLMGGVGNFEPYNMTFDLNTGELLTAADLFPVTGDSLILELQSITLDYLDTNGYDFRRSSTPNDYEILSAYTLEDYEFYIENDELVLTYPTYLLTTGAEGSLVIPTGLTIEWGDLKDRAIKKQQELADLKDSLRDRELYTYIGESLSALTESGELGSDYYDDYLDGGCFRYFSSIDAALFFDKWSDSDSVISVMTAGEMPCGWGLYSCMTYPEILENFTGDIELPEPEYYFNVLDNMYEYFLSFEIGGYGINYEWIEDPYAVPSQDIYIYQIRS